MSRPNQKLVAAPTTRQCAAACCVHELANRLDVEARGTSKGTDANLCMSLWRMGVEHVIGTSLRRQAGAHPTVERSFALGRRLLLHQLLRRSVQQLLVRTHAFGCAVACRNCPVVIRPRHQDPGLMSPCSYLSKALVQSATTASVESCPMLHQTFWFRCLLLCRPASCQVPPRALCLARRPHRRRADVEELREAEDRATGVPPQHRQPDARCAESGCGQGQRWVK